ncbi:hypothetical protein KEM54_003736, partial [Ascosphaera aggregata]
MKISQSAKCETATVDWVDLPRSFNACGNSYQDSSSSSARPGAGCGALAYFGNRPTHNLTLEGIIPISPVLDTFGIVTRNPQLWHIAAKVMYETNITSGFMPFPKTIAAKFPVAR